MSRFSRSRIAGFPAKARLWPGGSVLALALALSVGSAMALSEIKREDIPPPAVDGETVEEPLGDAVPMPDPVINLPDPAIPDEPAAEEADPGDDNGPPPQIYYDTQILPEPTRRMRELIIEAAKSGEIERLRPLIGLEPNLTQLSLGNVDGDPIAFLRELSGDDSGQEILAILEEVLIAGYVHLDVGTPNELYVWPYFFAVPLEKLDSRQRVELFKIVTAGDYEDMKNYGAYIFYRVGITPEGEWAFFVAGD